MCVDTVNSEINANIDTKDSVSWDTLIRDAELRITDSKTQIKRLQKSIRFFKEQNSCGKAFPNG